MACRDSVLQNIVETNTGATDNDGTILYLLSVISGANWH